MGEAKNLSETAYTHFHSNRCGHLGYWPLLYIPEQNHCSRWRVGLKVMEPLALQGHLRDIGSNFIAQVVDYWMHDFQWSKQTAQGLESAVFLDPLYAISLMSALMELGTEWRPCLRSHAIVSSAFQRWESSRHMVPSFSSQYFGMSARNCTSCFKEWSLNNDMLQ